MKAKTMITSAAAIAAAALLFAGCATHKPSVHTEELLQSCRFKIVTATTPEQKAQLQTLRPGKLTVVQRNAKTWYVYPDLAHQQAYVGTPDQYQAYRQAFQDDQMVRGAVDSILCHEDSVAWPYGGLDFGQ
jgi:hypothetical protein